jgi:hypothetical protein
MFHVHPRSQNVIDFEIYQSLVDILIRLEEQPLRNILQGVNMNAVGTKQQMFDRVTLFLMTTPTTNQVHRNLIDSIMSHALLNININNHHLQEEDYDVRHVFCFLDHDDDTYQEEEENMNLNR